MGNKRFGHTDNRGTHKIKLVKFNDVKDAGKITVDKHGVLRERIPGLKRNAKGEIIDIQGT